MRRRAEDYNRRRSNVNNNNSNSNNYFLHPLSSIQKLPYNSNPPLLPHQPPPLPPIRTTTALDEVEDDLDTDVSSSSSSPSSSLPPASDDSLNDCNAAVHNDSSTPPHDLDLSCNENNVSSTDLSLENLPPDALVYDIRDELDDVGIAYCYTDLYLFLSIYLCIYLYLYLSIFNSFIISPSLSMPVIDIDIEFHKYWNTALSKRWN